MNEVFLKILNMSISASWIVLVVLLLRFILKKAPKWVSVILWGIVALRLIFPFSIESALSLIPSAETIPLDIEMSETPTVHSGISVINNVVNPMIGQSNTPAVGVSVNSMQIVVAALAVVWIAGIAALLSYTAISYLHLRHRVGTAIPLRKRIYQSENVSSPFVLGIIKPKIYLPFDMSVEDLSHVIAHEQAHIRRKDYLWKPLGFLLLTLHWFNPLMWLAYVLLCRDIELACDEKVIKELSNEQRADYSQALLSCSVKRRVIAACPLAFGEVGVKERVKSVMNYKKPAFWIVLVAIIACVVLALCMLTNPVKTPFELGTLQLKWAKTLDLRPNEPTSFDLNDAELDELKSRLGKIEIGRKDNDLNGFTPLYSISIQANGYYFSVQGFDADGKNIALYYQKDYYRINDSEFSEYLRSVCAGRTREEIVKQLSLNDVIMFSQKGMELTWDDFSLFKSREIGAGLYILHYEINEQYYLLIGGVSDEAPPMYIYLCYGTNDDRIDIRIENVPEFIEKYQATQPEPPIADDTAYTMWVTSDCIYMVPFNSVFPTDDGNRYLFGNGELVIENRSTGEHRSYAISGDPEPFTQTDWKSWFGAWAESAPDISRYEGQLSFHDLSATLRLVHVGRAMWIMTLNRDGKQDTVWSVYSLDFGENMTYTAEVSWVNYAEEASLYTGCLNSDKMTISSVRHLPIFKCETTADLERFRTSYSDVLDFSGSYDEIGSFDDVCKGYDDNFFEENALFLVYVSAGSGSLRFGVDRVYADGENAKVYVNQLNASEADTDDMAGWLLSVGVSKTAIKGCTFFDAALGDY